MTEDRIQISLDPDELTHAAAEYFTECTAAAVRENGRCRVALSGGSTPRSLYALLARDSAPYRSRIPWDRIHFFWGDERHVPPEHADSNYRMAWETMLSRAPVPPENIHRIPAEQGDAEAAALAYEADLRTAFDLSVGELPRFDLVLLGLGPEGHTASLFPGSGALRESARLVAAPWVAELGAHRITLTPPVLNASAAILFLVSGPEKARALRFTLEGPPDPDLYPAQQIRPRDGTLLWFVDAMAAQLLQAATGRQV